jgi:HSP90 family molecular chaperone
LFILDFIITLKELIDNSLESVAKYRESAQIPEHNGEINIVFNSQQKTFSVIDTGIGMSADDIKKWAKYGRSNSLIMLCPFCTP